MYTYIIFIFLFYILSYLINTFSLECIGERGQGQLSMSWFSPLTMGLGAQVQVSRLYCKPLRSNFHINGLQKMFTFLDL